VSAGEAEIAAALRQNVVDAGKDAYKSFSAEKHRKVINRSISKNFGIDEENQMHKNL
jgi:TRAP-type C4-dicarboxylate transport system substrate-binding protein